MSQRAEGGGQPSGEVYDWYVRAVALLESGNPEAAAALLTHARAEEPSSGERHGRVQSLAPFCAFLHRPHPCVLRWKLCSPLHTALPAALGNFLADVVGVRT